MQSNANEVRSIHQSAVDIICELENDPDLALKMAAAKATYQNTTGRAMGAQFCDGLLKAVVFGLGLGPDHEQRLFQLMPPEDAKRMMINLFKQKGLDILSSI